MVDRDGLDGYSLNGRNVVRLSTALVMYVKEWTEQE